MSRGSWVIRNGELVERGSARDVETRRPRGPASSLPAPSVIRDCMDALRGQHDGRFYDSKSALRRSYRERGLVEIGNDTKAAIGPRPKRPVITEKDIGAAVQKVKQGYRPKLPAFADPELGIEG